MSRCTIATVAATWTRVRSTVVRQTCVGSTVDFIHDGTVTIEIRALRSVTSRSHDRSVNNVMKRRQLCNAIQVIAPVAALVRRFRFLRCGDHCLAQTETIRYQKTAICYHGVYTIRRAMMTSPVGILLFCPFLSKYRHVFKFQHPDNCS